MSNPFYNSTFLAVPLTTIRSQGDILQFQAIEQGFDVVNALLVGQAATIALRATIDSPAFTGAPTAPTPPIGDASTRIATTDFVAQLSFSSALPGQFGSAGKVVSTDGSSASWVQGSQMAMLSLINQGLV